MKNTCVRKIEFFIQINEQDCNGEKGIKKENTEFNRSR